MSWRIDPKTGDYVMLNGAPTEDESLIYPAYYRLKIKRTQWLYAPDTFYGSDFYTVKKHFRPNEMNSLSDIALKALQPIEDDGRASDLTATIQPSAGRNDAQLSIEIIDAMGQPQKLNLPVLPAG
jgi:phage gp46-like protein